MSAILTEDVQFRPRLTHFLLVSLEPGPMAACWLPPSGPVAPATWPAC
ncbi:hypothetical protein MUN84_10590 [Hymenobacter sp. 5516J-16]|nr:hypothetical protein [Hymenobacter sp. 5516J-16]UOQ78923.1 hypothetical protein MUN84_10590 [Hymenobacter sp. 5516J-16]